LKILALTRKTKSASFQRRVMDYVEPLGRRGIELTWQYIPKSRREKRRLLETLADYDAIWWHRYLRPPFRTEKWRRAARKIIFDFDDPIIYSTRGSGRRPNLSRRIKFSWFLRRCDAATAGSGYLADLARPYCGQVFIQPMAVDLPQQPPQRQAAPGKAKLLWLGSRSTMKFLLPLKPALEKVGELRGGASMRLVTHEPMPCEKLNVAFRRWSADEEAAALRECDIGLCPMPDTPWTRGKCPYKVLQYMAHGMAWVGSAVGENLVTAGRPEDEDKRGLCATNEAQWVEALLRLIDDAELRTALGLRGRAYVEQNHSLEALADRVADIFRTVTSAP
jgi:glycosyltransferase involved in cell wall biosynthesis